MPFHRAIPESKPPSKGSGALAGYVEAEKLMHLAFVMPAAVGIGWAAGWWADQKLHQSWIAIVGIVFGCISGLFYVIQTAIAAEKKSEKNSRSEDATRNGSGKGSSDTQA
jgi:F0F1-type ATP synthase assembly protein I